MAGSPIAGFGPIQTVVDAATQTFDVSSGSRFAWTLGANRTMSTPTNVPDGALIWLFVTQDATGSRTVTWPTNFRWSGASAPTLTTTAAKTDILWGVYDATQAKWNMATLGLNYT